MRRVRVRHRADGLRQVVPGGPFRSLVELASIACLGVPAALMVLVALVAVLPVAALAIPPAMVIAGGASVWMFIQRRRHPRAQRSARVIPLR